MQRNLIPGDLHDGVAHAAGNRLHTPPPSARPPQSFTQSDNRDGGRRHPTTTEGNAR